MSPMNSLKDDGETLDTFYHGRIRILQKKNGYRFSVDAPLLADFIRTQSQEELLEMGTGSGIISLLLSLKSFRHITALEIQPSLVSLARRNVHINALDDRISVLHQDLRTFRPRKKFDVVFSNPPFHPPGRGIVSAAREKAIAKHELKCDISDIMLKTAELLKARGRAYFIFPEARKAGFLEAAGNAGLRIAETRAVASRRDRAPHVFLSRCGFASDSPAAILPPLVLFEDDGGYTPEAREIFAGRGHGAASPSI